MHLSYWVANETLQDAGNIGYIETVDIIIESGIKSFLKHSEPGTSHSCKMEV